MKRRMAMLLACLAWEAWMGVAVAESTAVREATERTQAVRPAWEVVGDDAPRRAAPPPEVTRRQDHQARKAEMLRRMFWMALAYR